MNTIQRVFIVLVLFMSVQSNEMHGMFGFKYVCIGQDPRFYYDAVTRTYLPVTIKIDRCLSEYQERLSSSEGINYEKHKTSSTPIWTRWRINEYATIATQEKNINREKIKYTNQEIVNVASGANFLRTTPIKPKPEMNHSKLIIPPFKSKK